MSSGCADRGRLLLARRQIHQALLHADAEGLIVIDCSDLKADQSLHLLRASVPAPCVRLV